MKTFVPLWVAALAILQYCASASAASCSPFGNPPAEVNRGLYASFVSRHTPICHGGKTLGPWRDANGDDRYVCLYEPPSAAKDNPLPMVVFLHGSMTTADSVLITGLTSMIDKADLGGKRPGFILLAPQGRYTSHFYPGFDSNAFGWDNWYRQLSPSGDAMIGGATYPQNVDASAIDHFIAELVRTGEVDTRRIYMMGWSNGAAMAMLYAMNRPLIAAAAVYSAPDPFASLFDVCPQTPVAVSASGDGQIHVTNPKVPLMHVRNSCDIGGICPNGSRFAARVRSMGGSIDDAIIDASGARLASCDAGCGTDEMGDGQISRGEQVRGFMHHVSWPSGWNEKMLRFLKVNPLPEATGPFN